MESPFKNADEVFEKFPFLKDLSHEIIKEIIVAIMKLTLTKDTSFLHALTHLMHKE